jgi:hypothetical protein
MRKTAKRRSYFLFILIAIALFNTLNCSTSYRLPLERYNSYEGEVNQHSRVIRMRSDEIFQIITDEKELNRICPKGTSIGYEEPLPFQVGTLVRTKIEHIFKLDWTSRIEEITPYKRIRLTFLNGFFSGGTEIWELEEKDMSTTKVIHTIIVQPKGLLKRLAWELKLRLKHDKMVEAFLDNLERLAVTERLHESA